ncbi:TetR/AcrR family transcriptional regulator [Erythrobacter sp. LQ02-29]|uniref:TetR/AcrR family transcriptional regulator n=1 Tax=Erythrobacter sp. LQ02-29 TaxID=2920384 RepID=UPI001F4E3D9D|nr:helix-turn-helix domain-containing protein [Erythrobacter sp. LQ02-29]MCP9221695.1 TetR/AcrR family transcriptional regulator [Erythrobacter sp. LQ02-29]
MVDALAALLAERRYEAIRVADIIARAGVGKSTFYEHFRGKDDVLLAAMQPILLALTTAASGRAAHSYIRPMVAHLWERRSIVRPILESTAALPLERRLAEAMATHGGRPAGGDQTPIQCVGMAAAQLAMLRHWLSGRAVATTEEMTGRLIACSRIGDGDHPS